LLTELVAGADDNDDDDDDVDDETRVRKQLLSSRICGAQTRAAGRRVLSSFPRLTARSSVAGVVGENYLVHSCFR
jgi:hypothetical protein